MNVTSHALKPPEITSTPETAMVDDSSSFFNLSKEWTVKYEETAKKLETTGDGD